MRRLFLAFPLCLLGFVFIVSSEAFSYMFLSDQHCFEGTHIAIFAVSVLLLLCVTALPVILAVMVHRSRRNQKLSQTQEAVAISVIDEYKSNTYFFGIVEMLIVRSVLVSPSPFSGWSDMRSVRSLTSVSLFATSLSRTTRSISSSKRRSWAWFSLLWSGDDRFLSGTRTLASRSFFWRAF